MTDNQKPQEKSNAAVWAAVITALATIIAAFLGFPPLIVKLDSIWNPIPTTPAVGALTETPAASLGILPAETENQAIAMSLTEMPTITPIPSQLPTAGVMIAQIKANYFEGKAPLRATFRADSSYVTFPDGSVETCEFAHVCSYTWDVRAQNGPIIHGPVTGGSEFSYEFSKKGEFIVVVYVCRGQACSFTSVSITTR